jgi:hypothetical protein
VQAPLHKLDSPLDSERATEMTLPVLQAAIVCKRAAKNEDGSWTLEHATNEFTLPVMPSTEAPYTLRCGLYVQLFASHLEAQETLSVVLAAGNHEVRTEVPITFRGEKREFCTIGGELALQCSSVGKTKLKIFWGDQPLGVFPFRILAPAPA